MFLVQMGAADISSFPPNHPPEFRTFVDHTESGLWALFQNIDRNNNGEIDLNELKTAFAKSGVTVSSAKLDDFFRDVDANKDGVISYQEWRWATSICQNDFVCVLGVIQTTNGFPQRFPPLSPRSTVTRPSLDPVILHGHGQSKP